jgi:MFS family permease
MTEVSQPPYRWVIVFVAAVALALAMGQLVNGLSVFVVPLELEFGWRRGDIALINTAGLAGLAVGGLLMGRLAERFGTRQVMLAGAAVLGLCVAGASQAQALWQFYLLFLAAGFLGGAAFYAPLIALVGNWFTAGAGLALGLASAGQALGQGGIPVVATLLIESLGWRGAFVGLGAGTLAILLPLALLAREPARRPPGSVGGSDEGPHIGLPHKLVLPLLGLAVLGCCTLMAVPLMHLVPLMLGRGVPAADAGGVMLAMLTAGIAGRICFGRLADRIGALPAYMTASLWQTAMVFGFTLFQSLDGFYAYALLYGFGYAGVMTGVLTTTRALTPASRRASAMGVIGVFGWGGHGLGGYLGGLLFDVTGGYVMSFAIAVSAGLLNLAVLTVLLLATRQRRLQTTT